MAPRCQSGMCHPKGTEEEVLSVSLPKDPCFFNQLGWLMGKSDLENCTWRFIGNQKFKSFIQAVKNLSTISIWFLLVSVSFCYCFQMCQLSVL